MAVPTQRHLRFFPGTRYSTHQPQKGANDSGGAAYLEPYDFSTQTDSTIERLTSRQRAHLRGLAHDLKPVVHIGKEGVTAAALHALEEAFHTRELLKVKVLDNAPEEPRETGHALAQGLDGVQVVQTMGRIVTLYRPDPDATLPVLPPG